MTDTATPATAPPTSGLRLLPRTARIDRLVVTVTEAGELLGISRAFAYELAARGELPVIRFGRRLLVPKRALFELVGAGPDAVPVPASVAPLVESRPARPELGPC